MIFSKAFPYKSALDAAQVRVLLPTTARTREFAQIVADGRGAVLERARFSAGVRKVAHLAVIDDGINAIVAGASDFATQRLAIRQLVRGTGYMAPEDQRGGLQDLESERRTNLQLQVGVQQAQGYGFWKQGQQEDLLYAFPGREFLRVESRDKPRDNWPQRWNAARAATTMDGATDSASGRMVALVNHPIWAELSVFGTPHEPFDFGSGMGQEDVARRECVDLGIIEPDTHLFPQDRPFNQDLQASLEVRSEKLRALLEETGIGKFNAKGVFVAHPSV